MAHRPPMTVGTRYELNFKFWMENVRTIVIDGNEQDRFDIWNRSSLPPGFEFTYIPMCTDENLLLVKYTPPKNVINKGKPRDGEVIMQIQHEQMQSPISFDLILKFDKDELPVVEDLDIGISTECSICLNQFGSTSFVPKVLECGHTFCMECLNKIFYDGYEIDIRNQMCPLDREYLDDFPERLPVNRALLDMMEEVTKKLAPPKDPILSCVENSDHKPETYCKKCQEAFCESCFAELHTFKAMKNHTTVPIEQICSKHRKTAEFICLDHSHESWQRSFCDICQKEGTHSKHNHDSFEGYEAKRRKQLEELLEKIRTREDHACEQLKLFDEYYLTYDEDGVEMENARLDCERNYGAKMWKVLSSLASAKKQHLIEGKAKFENVLSDAEKYKETVKIVLAKKFDFIDIKKQLSEVYSFVNEETEELHPLSFYICTGASQQSGNGNKRDGKKEDEREAKIPRIDFV